MIFANFSGNIIQMKLSPLLPNAPTTYQYNLGRISLFFTCVWVLYLLLSPIYLFSKGLPQPADYLIFACGFPALIVEMMRHKGKISAVFLFGALFAILTIVVNWIHFSFVVNDRLLKHSLYYIFNFCVFMYTLSVFKQDPKTLNKLTYYAVAAIIIFEFLYAPLFGEIEVLRNLGSFNNPNQLAYWSLLNIGILVILKRDQKFTIFDFVLIAMCIFLQSLSLSKAGMILTVLMLGILLLLPNVPKAARLFICIGTFMFLLVQLFEPSSVIRKLEQVDQVTKIVSRIQNIGQESDDSAEGRGYDRLLKFPHYLAFGAGEGAYFRFGRGSQEIHSGIATLIFSYGVMGFVFFGLFVWAGFRGVPRQYWLILGVIFLFGIPHQNIRFTYFWVFLALAHTHHMYFDQKKLEEEKESLDGPHNK